MNEWHKYPFVRIILPFGLGILFSMKHSFEFSWHLALLVFTFILTGIAFVLHKKISYHNRLIFGGFIVLALFASGIIWHGSYNLFQRHHHFSEFYSGHEAITGSFRQLPEKKANSRMSIVEAEQIHDSAGGSHPVKGKIMVYFAKEANLSDVKYGDKVIFSGFIKRVDNPKNPEAFDYRSYLEQRNIYHTVYLDTNSFRHIPHGHNSLMGWSVQTRKQLAKLLQDYGVTGKEFSLVSALVLGYDKYLADDIRLWYSNAGAMHILCVSGLHVGIIYVVMMFLMNFIPLKSKSFHVFKVLFVIGFIWGYAFITGLEPAVMRASVMFSMVAAGKLLNRKPRIYNTLAASAFIMLLSNPNMLSWVGFQMSYLAVFGIVWLQPRIYAWWTPRWKIVDYFWGLIAVSLAAQIVLFPLLLYYFNKVSLVFFITNLFAIPAATLMLYLALLFFAFSWQPLIAGLIAKGLHFLAKGMNLSIEKVSELPAAYLDEIWLHDWHIMLIYPGLFIILVLLMKHRKYVVPAAMGALILIFVVLGGIRFHQQHNDRFILYHMRNGLAMDFVSGESGYFIADSVVLNDEKSLDFQVRNSWRSNYIQPEPVAVDTTEKLINRQIYWAKPFFMFRDNIYFILDKEPDIKPDRKIEVDYLILSGKPWLDVSELLSKFSIRKKVLISGSTPAWLSEKWEKAFKKENVECYSTHKEGAFILVHRR